MSISAADVKSIFARALELPPAERAAYLEQACAGTPELRGEVEGLLAALEGAGSFMGRPATAHFERDVEGPGTSIGPYRLLQEIGAGGMGIVYMAEQQQPLRRLVAVKIIKPGMDSAQVIARFESERQALALMDHPNIAKVLDAGTTPSGRPFFVMELVKGVPITQFCDERQLTPRERLELFVPVCQAVQHAHQKGVIHRDLKPSNVLVALYDDRPVPKVIDFGVAKATSQRLTERTLFTSFGAVVGTPEYMSPEQAQLNALDVDTRSDIYSLGVMLYELLTGSTPLGHEALRQAALDELLRRVREEEPPRPSLRLSQSGAALAAISARRRTEPAQLGRVLRGELDWIVMKALEKERARRYDAAGALAHDLQRYLADEPVEAGPPSAGYRLRKLARRHRTALVTATAFGLLLTLAALGATLLAISARQAERQAMEAHAVAEAAREAADKARKQAEDNAKRAAAAAHGVRRQHYVMAVNQAQAAWDQLDTTRVRRLLNETVPGPGEEDLRHFEWRYLTRLVHSAQLSLQPLSGNPVIEDLAFTPDGKTLFSLGRFGDVHVWDVDGRRTAQLETRIEFARQFAVYPDGRRVAVCGPGAGVQVWDLVTRKCLRRLDGHNNAWCVALGRGLLASGDGDLTVRLWDDVGRLVAELEHTGHIAGLAFSSDGRMLATASNTDLPEQATVRLWDTATRKMLALVGPRRYRLNSVALSADGGLVALAGGRGLDRPGSIEVVETATGKVRWESTAHREEVRRVVFSADGSRLASAAHDSTVRLWDVASGAEVQCLRGQSNWYVAVAFSPDAARLAAAGHEGTIEIWRPGHNPEVQVRRGELGLVDKAALHAGSGRVAELRVFRGVRVRDALSGAVHAQLEGNALAITAPAFSPEGDRVALGFADGTIRLWDAATGRLHAEIAGADGDYHGLALSVGGRRLAAATAARGGATRVRVWDVATGSEVASVGEKQDDIDGIALSSDGKTLATGSGRRRVSLWQVDGARRLRNVALSADRSHPPSLLIFSPDAGRLAAADAGSGIDVFEVEGEFKPLRLLGHRRTVRQIAFSPDGQRLASASDDETMRLWDVATGQEVLRRPGPAVPHGLGFSEDCRRLLALARDGTVHSWEGDSRRAVTLGEQRVQVE